MIERAKRWVASCGEDCESRVGKLERPSAGRTRNLRVFFFLLRLVRRLCSASERRSTKHRNTGTTLTEAEDTAPKMCGLQTKNRSKINENPYQIDQKSTKYRCWAILGAQDRFGDASGRAQDGLRTAKCRLKTDLETLRAGQERPRDVQKRPWAAPKTFPDGLGAMSERVWSIEHH